MPARELGPVLKWAGGKRQLLPQILARLPSRIETYFEPFVGGGAVFFELSSKQRFRRAVLADQNPDLVSVYLALKQDPEALIRALARYQVRHSEDEYYRVREQRPRSLIGRAARVIYLNKTGFNGLYRVNKSGGFNVPFGRYEKPRIVNEVRLRAAARALQSVEIRVGDFAEICALARPGDAVYLDPPYLPVSKTANFAEYHSAPFGLDEHERLAQVFATLRERGVAAVLSNSDTVAARRLFRTFQIDRVSVRRAINSDRTRRGPVGEILVQSSVLPKAARQR